MAVNGIEIKVGQTWRTRCGDVEAIVSTKHTGRTQYARFPVLSQSGISYTREGRFSTNPREQNPCDLFELIADVPGATAMLTTTVAAPDLLEAAAGHMRDRAATYDKPEGERSMAQTVAVFNQFHGTALTEAQGWHFMQILKDVRLFANPANPHRDSVEDGVAYSALKGEAILKGGV